MDYQEIYNKIIFRAQLLPRKKVKGGQYFEEHHIIPTSIGGSNLKENKVLLTAREHFICHKLLVEIYPDNRKLHHAVWMMTLKVRSERTYEVSSRDYEYYKSLFVKSQSDLMTKKYEDPNERRLQSERISEVKSTVENREAQSKKLKKFYEDPINRLDASDRTTKRNSDPVWRKEHSIKISKLNENPEYRKTTSDSMKLVHKDPVYKEKFCNSMKELMQREGIREQISTTWKNKELVKCPHCPVESINASNMRRFHFDNCKFKKELIETI